MHTYRAALKEYNRTPLEFPDRPRMLRREQPSLSL